MRTSYDKEFDAILVSMKKPIETNADLTISLIRSFMIARPNSAHDIDYISTIVGGSWGKIISNLGLPDMNDQAYGTNLQPQLIYQLNDLEKKILRKIRSQVAWSTFNTRRKIHVD